MPLGHPLHLVLALAYRNERHAGDFAQPPLEVLVARRHNVHAVRGDAVDEVVVRVRVARAHRGEALEARVLRGSAIEVSPPVLPYARGKGASSREGASNHLGEAQRDAVLGPKLLQFGHHRVGDVWSHLKRLRVCVRERTWMCRAPLAAPLRTGSP